MKRAVVAVEVEAILIEGKKKKKLLSLFNCFELGIVLDSGFKSLINFF